MKTIAFFNNKGGVGKTTLVYHLAWMMADRGLKTLVVDLDPQANVTSMFLDETRLAQIWPEEGDHPKTIFGAIRPILRGIGDVAAPHVEKFGKNLSLIPGDLGLSTFEDKLSDAWPRCHNRDESAFRTMTAFHRLIQAGGGESTDVALIDVGPNLGAINRAALISSDHVLIPLAPDLFSLQGLRNLGPALRDWRDIWKALIPKGPKDISLPKGEIRPAGYVVMQHGVRDNRPVIANQRWMDRIPKVYRDAVLDDSSQVAPSVVTDPYKLALLKHYRSLMSMAMEARKPIFHLKAADGAIGAHGEAVRDCYGDFFNLAKRVAAEVGLPLG
ncbi:MAG: ParA family protein [Nevskia sp.]|uniref:ParA family protein n=1 Tax=Nevskia sp. TaxID=1929292 RepID=UPI004035845A